MDEKRRKPMSVRFNEDKKLVEMLKEGLRRKDGYCPCRLEKIEDNKCMCKEFREQIADPDFEGYCHCKLYYKSKD
ncbi:MAG: ferredoxin-thioredoxin reductase catalytic domain-containing protein [Clostridia bacterium]|nr:ferredoxin-thioredoxin reductase catalytic domain-containing protein [Clostridia bacterium]